MEPNARVPDVPPPADDRRWLVRTLALLTGVSEEDAAARLRAEEARLGSGLRDEFRRRGVRPHVWSEGIAAIYRESAAPLYEGVAWNLSFVKRGERRWVVDLLGRTGRKLDVLCFGDGCGFESLALRLRGHAVSYHDTSGAPRRFAEAMFSAARQPVKVFDSPEELPPAGFDAVVCLDVLEHCPEPPAVVASLTRLLRPEGVLVCAAPFFLVAPCFPAHLDSGRRFSGDFAGLYGANGLRVVDGRGFWMPLVLARDGEQSVVGESPAAARGLLALSGLALRLFGLLRPLVVAGAELDRVRGWAATLGRP